MAKVGIIATASKPFHSGHHALIKIASDENDEVKLFASLNDRIRKGEHPIYGNDMAKIWKQHIEPILPNNVNVEYTTGVSPVRCVYSYLGDKNESNSTDEFAIYSDPNDALVNFPERSLIKYLGMLHAKGQIKLVPIDRTQTVNVSGTQMRRWLADGDIANFSQHLPRGIDSIAVWRLLGGK